MTDRLQGIGCGCAASLRDMVAALECDYERLDELRESEDLTDDEKTELEALKETAGDCTDYEDALTRIQEDPLSIEYRSGWSTDPGDLQTSEVCILLSTGGPASRIMADYDDGRASRPRLEVQDWGTPWTEYFEDGLDDVLLTYCQAILGS